MYKVLCILARHKSIVVVSLWFFAWHLRGCVLGHVPYLKLGGKLCERFADLDVAEHVRYGRSRGRCDVTSFSSALLTGIATFQGRKRCLNVYNLHRSLLWIVLLYHTTFEVGKTLPALGAL